MAKVAPEAPRAGHREEYALRSGVRSGLKREFVFALKAQAEMMMAPRGRTRSGKVQHSSAPPREAGAKRRRRSDGGRPPAAADDSPILSAPVVLREAEPDEAVVVNVDVGRMGDETTNAVLPAIQIDGAVVENFEPMLIEPWAAAETPLTIPVEAGTIPVEMGIVMEMPQVIQIEGGSLEDTAASNQVGTSPVVNLPQGIPVEAESVVDKFPSIPIEVETLADSLLPIQVEAEASADTISSTQLDAGLMVKSPWRIPMIVEMTTDSAPATQVDAIAPQRIQTEAESATDAILSTQVDAWPMVETPQIVQIKSEAITDAVPSTQANARPMVETPQTIQVKAEATADTSPSIQVEAMSEIFNRIPQKAEENGVPEKPMRRFTRSLLKTAVRKPPAAIVEESPLLMAQYSPVSTGQSDGLEQIKGYVEAMNGPHEPLSVTPKRKMELKMSKKIALSKFPTNIRVLLATGLLDGLAVKYAVRSFHKEEGLRGVIKDGGILCYCASCKGLKIISAYNFELHAGSKKKHPSDFIFLENGNSLHDILRACSSAPLDMLESTIQNAISYEGAKPLKCDGYRESSIKSHIDKLATPCDSRVVTKLNPTSSNPSHEALSAARHRRSAFAPKSSDGTSKTVLSQKSIRGRMTRKDLRLHKLVFMDDILPEGTEVAYYARGQKLLEGYIAGSGIFCHCCKAVISPSLFEAHAGWASRRKPYLNIYTSNGVSLHELSVSLSKGKKFSVSESDDLCRICADGGDLLLCDLCPRAFHKECVGLTSVPKEDWYCPCCENMHLKDKSVVHNENAIAAGRVAGVDPIEQIFKRCIRIAKTPENDVGGCVLCRCHDFSKVFGPRTVLLCDQCEREFHVGCLKEHNMGNLEELPDGKWFCSPNCEQVHIALQKLVASGPEQLPLLQSDLIKRRYEQMSPGKEVKLDVRWRLLRGKTASPETRLLLSQALSIFHENFDPILDYATKKNLIPAMVYGWDFRDQDFGGMHCAVLTVNSSVVSAAILRVLGCEVAEVPLVATSRESQGKGCFQSLFSCIEGMLGSLNVKHIVLPAAEEAESIWTKRFCFSKISVGQPPEYIKGYHMMMFQGTSMLHKMVIRSVTDG